MVTIDPQHEMPVSRRKWVLLQDPSHPPSASVTETVAHELAHIWFGNLVTARHWSNIYLNEAFASHFGSAGGHAVASEIGIDVIEFE